jgi:hypothetical protein
VFCHVVWFVILHSVCSLLCVKFQKSDDHYMFSIIRDIVVCHQRDCSTQLIHALIRQCGFFNAITLYFVPYQFFMVYLLLFTFLSDLRFTSVVYAWNRSHRFRSVYDGA